MVVKCKHLWSGEYGHHCKKDMAAHIGLTFEHSRDTHIGDCEYFKECEFYEPEEVE